MKTVIETATVKLVLEALEAATRYGAGGFEDAKDALRVALAEQPAQQEPVGHFINFDGRWVHCKNKAPHTTAFYTSPQPAQRKPLTDEEIEREWQFLHDEEGNPPDHHDFARAIEFALGIKENT